MIGQNEQLGFGEVGGRRRQGDWFKGGRSSDGIFRRRREFGRRVEGEGFVWKDKLIGVRIVVGG